MQIPRTECKWLHNLSISMGPIKRILRKFHSTKGYITKFEKSQVNNLRIHMKPLEIKPQQNKSVNWKIQPNLGLKLIKYKQQQQEEKEK